MNELCIMYNRNIVYNKKLLNLLVLWIGFIEMIFGLIYEVLEILGQVYRVRKVMEWRIDNVIKYYWVF